MVDTIALVSRSSRDPVGGAPKVLKMACIVLLVGLLAAPLAKAGGLTNNPELVLDIEEGSFRLFMGWKTPTLIGADKGLRPLLWPMARGSDKRDAVPINHSWYPPKEWVELNYDDTYWPRSRGPVHIPQWARFGELWNPGNPAEFNVVCLRGAFEVTDPKKVSNAKLELLYHGGAVIYVNGKELHRGNLPKGPLTFETLADPFPLDAYVRPDGLLYGWGDKQDRHYFDRLATRVRQIPGKGWLDAVAIPNEMLRRGVNVIAIEVHAAPLNEVASEGKAEPGGWQEGPCQWPHAGVTEARLIVTQPTGLVQNVAPSPGIQVAVCHPWETLRAHDYVLACEKPGEISIAGVRNGSFYGRIIVGSCDPIRRLRVKVTDLARKEGKETIAAAGIRIRYAEPCRQDVTWRTWPNFDRLLDEPPDEVEARPMAFRGRNLQPVPTALVPVWVTVRVPADAAPGLYEGTVTVEAEDLNPVRIPFRLKVYDWALPDTKDYRMTHNIYQSPDTIATYYKVPLWSDRHFELMGKSLEILAGLGSRICVVPLIVDSPHIRNTETMVRWVKEGDGTFKHDFRIMDRYLDLFAKYCGKPRILAFNHLEQEKQGSVTKRMPVTVADGATGKLETMLQPVHGTDEDLAFWRPVFTEIRKRLEQRGWYDAAAVRHVSYCWSASDESIKTYKAMWPDGKWVSSCHGARTSFGGMPVPCTEWVWGAGGMYDPDSNNPRLRTGYPHPWTRMRGPYPATDLKIARELHDNGAISEYRFWPELTLQMNLHGMGQHGGDFFPVVRNVHGRFEHFCDGAGGLGITTNVYSFLCPGPNGAVSTERAEAWRDGVQVTETIAFVRSMLDEKKVGGELAKRAEDMLIERARHLCRTGYRCREHWLATESSNSQERDERLYALAAEIAAAKGKGDK